jgi:hypothetical protein
MKRKIDEIIKYREIRSSGNSFYFVLLFIIIAGYMFFLNSKTIFQKNEVTISATNINAELTYQRRTIKLIRWDYASSEHTCEIELDIRNMSFDGNDEYIFRAYSRTNSVEKELPVEIILNDSTIAVVQIRDIPEKFAELCLHVGIKGQENSSVLKVYATRDSVTRVAELPVRTKQEYQLNRISLQVEEYLQKIKENEELISGYKSRIEAAEDQIKEFTDQLKYQTEKMQEETQSNISQAYAEIDQWNTKIESLEKENGQLQIAINKMRSQLSEEDTDS